MCCSVEGESSSGESSSGVRSRAVVVGTGGGTFVPSITPIVEY